MKKLTVDRRQFFKTSALGALAFSRCTPSGNRSGGKPNVIIILSDDQGYGDFSCHGNPVLRTPNFDRLHDEGIRLTDFHVTPVCTPTRSQLMTGLDAMHNRACCVPSGRNLMRRDIPTLTELMKGGGYRTGLFGKWHLGDAYPDRPMDRGFEKVVWFRGYGLESEIEFDNDYMNPRYLNGTAVKRADGYCTDFWFREAIRWMDGCRKRNEPFFVYLPTNVPHGPLWPEEKYAAIYRDKVNPRVADYFGMIANLDDNIGWLYEWLLKSGLRENTILIFMNDNGGTAGRSVWNAGLRDGKSSHYDGGHRAACFISWPLGGMGNPRDIAVPSQVQDILPTLLDLCSIQAPRGLSFDGMSLVPLFQGREIADRMFVVQFGGRIRPEKWEGAVVWNQWRLQNGVELYDILSDRGQKKDVAGQHPDIVRKMRDHYEKWWQTVEPHLYDFIPMVIGSSNENPVILTSNNWQEVDVDNLRRVSLAEGGPRGGVWNVQVEKSGRYRIELRRWPFHTEMALNSMGPRKTVNGREMTHEVRIITAEKAWLEVDKKKQSLRVSPSDIGAVFEVMLEQGRCQMQGWFSDGNDVDLCGAFYARITRM